MFGYDGYRYAPDTGLCHTSARYHDPRLGRFLQTDPIGQAGGLHLYAYVFNAAPNLSGAPGQSPVQDDHAAPGLLERLNPISAAHAQSLTPAKADLLWDELRGGGHTLEKHVGKTQAWLDKSIEPGVMVEGSVDLSKLR